MNFRVSSVAGTPQEQLGSLLESFTGILGTDQASVSATYPVILGLRCVKCGAVPGARCTVPSNGKTTYPHSARIQDAVAFVAHLIRMESLQERYRGSGK